MVLTLRAKFSRGERGGWDCYTTRGMCKHSTPDGGQHPENPDRIKVIWNKLQAAAIPQRYSTDIYGEGPGAGYNINVPWENGRCGDADYFAVWDHILVPVAKEFNPDLIIVSAGFDAAAGDPLGGGCVTPYGYAVMLKKLMNFAHGKIVLALEGGYNLESVANSVLACVEVLLEDNPIRGSSEAYPFESTWRVIQAVRQKLSSFWPSLADELPEKLTNKKAPPAAPSNLPARDAPWNGGFILDAATPGEFIGGFQARPPCKVHPKAYAFSQKMPLIVNANWLPRSSIWTDIFQDNDPVLEDVALYFFPDENIERSRENHARLINRMENQNSMIRICFDGKGMELLIFTSGSLQLDSRVADFVWGIFRCIKKDVAHNKVPEGLPSTVDQENVDDNKIVDMEVDMVGGKMVGRVDRVVPRDSKVIWNTKSSSAYPQPWSEMKTRCGLQKNLGKEEGKIPPETEEEESAGPPGFS